MDWKQICDDLSGQNGLIYLMFLGREITGEDVAKELNNIKPKILAQPKDQVYNALSSLTKKGYITEVRKEGRRKIRTAELRPITETNKKHDVSFEDVEIELIRTMGRLMKYFPKFVASVFEMRNYNIRRMEWDILYEIYFRYLTNLSIKSLEVNLPNLVPKDEKEDFSEFWKVGWALFLSVSKIKRISSDASEYLDKIFKKTTKNEQTVLIKFAIGQFKQHMERIKPIFKKIRIDYDEISESIEDLLKKLNH